MILAAYADGGGDGRTAGIGRGVSEEGRAWVRTAGGGHRRQVFTKTAGHVLTKVRGTTGDGRGWVMTALGG